MSLNARRECRGVDQTFQRRGIGRNQRNGRTRKPVRLRTSKNARTHRATRPKRVLVVDRHTLMRRVAAGWISRCSGLTVCGMTGGMADAFRAVKRLRPDVVVSEIMRPSDLGFIRELHQRHPRLPILVFSIQNSPANEARAREAGARGYLAKGGGGDQLVRRICAVLRRRKVPNHERAVLGRRDRRRMDHSARVQKRVP